MRRLLNKIGNAIAAPFAMLGMMAAAGVILDPHWFTRGLWRLFGYVATGVAAFAMVYFLLRLNRTLALHHVGSLSTAYHKTYDVLLVYVAFLTLVWLVVVAVWQFLRAIFGVDNK